MSEQCQQPQAHPERCGCAPAGTEQVSSAWLAQLRAEYRQFGDEVERLRGVVAAKDAEIAQLRQHKNDYMEAAEQTARALRNEINDHQEEIRRLDARVSQLAAQQAAVPEIPQCWSKSLSRCWPAETDCPEGDWIVGTVDEDGQLYEVLRVEASQYDAEGESQKIAEAIVKLWAFSAAPSAPQQGVSEMLDWAVGRWQAEVSQRPLVNVHRRALDDSWRQVIRRLGGDPVALCGPAHDDIARLNADRSVQGEKP